MFDYIIVGQGIAGSMLAWQLLKRGCKVLVIDKLNPGSASNIALGIIRPITGRRFVKTWLADEVIPYAVIVYEDLGNFFGREFIRTIPAVKLFNSVKEQNDWSVRCASEEYQAYLQNETIVELDKTKIKNDFGGFEISHCFKVENTLLLSLIRRYLKENNCLLEEEFLLDKLQQDDVGVRYRNFQAKKIFFCEGAAAAQNPLFKFLPFLLAKGERLSVEIKNFYKDKIINGDVIIVYTGFNDLYEVGATHEWDFKDAQPSEKGRAELEKGLRSVLNCDYRVVDHKSAVRPTVKDRRPFMGFHSQYRHIGIFNGIGTKGISIAPYFSEHFTKHLLDGEKLLEEVDIKRFI